MMSANQPFDRIVETHGATVLRVVRAVLGPHADADDAWSETFLAALGAWPDLPEDANVEAWLVTIAHRKAIDVVRRRGRHALPVAEVPEPRSAVGPADDGHELWAAVARLPDKQRRSIAYHYLGGLTYAEVATILGGSADAARRAAADGMKKLRSHFRAGEVR